MCSNVDVKNIVILLFQNLFELLNFFQLIKELDLDGKLFVLPLSNEVGE